MNRRNETGNGVSLIWRCAGNGYGHGHCSVGAELPEKSMAEIRRKNDRGGLAKTSVRQRKRRRECWENGNERNRHSHTDDEREKMKNSNIQLMMKKKKNTCSDREEEERRDWTRRSGRDSALSARPITCTPLNATTTITTTVPL